MIAEESQYILEYNDQQGKFHFNDGSKWPDTFGWSTICKALSYGQCLEFKRLMEEKYPVMAQGSGPANYPAEEVIRQEFVKFLLT